MTKHIQRFNLLCKYSSYFIDKQNLIPFCVSPNGLYYIHEKDITLKELMRIKDVCKNHPSDHNMLTSRTIKHLGINISGSTIEAYMQAHPQEICSFSIINTIHPSSRIGSSKRENTTERRKRNILFA